MGTSELGFCTCIMGILSLRSLVNPAGDLRKYLTGCSTLAGTPSSYLFPVSQRTVPQLRCTKDQVTLVLSDPHVVPRLTKRFSCF